MGCFWEIDCSLRAKTPSDAELAMERAKELINSDLCDYFIKDAGIHIYFSEHASYGFGSFMSDKISQVVKEYGLTGETGIHCDESYDPPEMITYEDGKTVYWDAVVEYKRRAES